MICIHPIITHDCNSLIALQGSTGLQVILGKRYLRLINNDGSTPASTPFPYTLPTHSIDHFTLDGNAA